MVNRLLFEQLRLTFLWALRDRVLHAVLGVGVFLLLLVPVFSSFSMRQVQESAVALGLSATSLTLLAVAVLLGSAAVFRDVDRRYATAVLGLPVPRSVYVLGRLLGLALFLVLAGATLAVCSAGVIVWAASTYPSAQPIAWPTLALAFAAIVLKAILLAAVALFFSALSTSFSLPFFCTLAVWLAGSASQEAYDYLTGSFGENLPAAARFSAKLFYYLLPNFSGLNLELQAVYGLPLQPGAVFGSFVYALLYTAVVAWLGMAVFRRRELP